MRRRHSVLFWLLWVIVGLVPGSFLAGQGVDHTDPVKVANFVLTAIYYKDAPSVVQAMDPEQKKLYEPLTVYKRQELERNLEKDKEKIGDTKEVSELRACTTLSGKPGIAAQIRKKGDELYVIILLQEGELYYYDTILTLLPKAYKDLKLIQKVK